jgi:hypothetical protein
MIVYTPSVAPDLARRRADFAWRVEHDLRQLDLER